jgi:hypothetical protein
VKSLVTCLYRQKYQRLNLKEKPTASLSRS